MKGRVLVVDDDAALAEMLGIVLRGEGFEPTFVADGDKAMDVFRDTRPDLVLLDLMLPGSDGIDVCRQIRAESGIPIVMLTAKTDTVDIVLGLESGADDYIVKPFKSKELVARIRARLRRTDEPARPDNTARPDSTARPDNAESQVADAKIRVDVETAFVPGESDPAKTRYVFAYTITIRNEGGKPARLLARHWIITDANGSLGGAFHQPVFLNSRRYHGSGQ